ncbi:HAD family hydrolase [Natrialbaceae archaeon A-CW2]
MSTAVYFDLDGTLCTYTKSFDEQFATTVEPYGEPTDSAYELYVERLFRALETCEPNPYRRAFEAVVEQTPLEAAPKTLAREHCQTELKATAVSREARQVVERVGNSRQTGILTNGDGRQQRAKIDRHGLGELVDTVVVSNELGVRKPDREIFETARERLPADEHVYVGDTFDEDIVGAHEAGFQTVYVAGTDTTISTRDTDTAGEVADAIVSDVSGLLYPESLPQSLSRAFEVA